MTTLKEQLLFVSSPSEDNRKTVDLLQAQGHEVVIVSSKEELSSALHGDSPRLALVTESMGLETALEFVRHLRREEPSHLLPILWVRSAAPNEAVLASAYASGVNDCVDLAGSTMEMLERVRNLLTHARLFRLLSTRQDWTPSIAATGTAGVRTVLTEKNTSGLPTWSWDMRTGTVSWSEAKYRFHGEMPGSFEPSYKYFLQSIHPEDRARVQSTIESSAKTARSYELSYRLLLRDGTIRPVIERGGVECDEEGKPVRMSGIVQDRTDDLAFQENLQRFQTLTAVTGTLARVGGWEVDLQKNLVYWSPMVGELHGMPPGFIPDVATAIQFYTEESRPVIEEAFRKCVQEGIPYDLDLQIRRADGRILDVRTIGESVQDQTGKVIRVHGAFQDVTRIHEMVRELRRNEARLRRQASLLDIASDAIIVRDRDGRIQFWNRSAERLYGLKAEEVMGKPLKSVLACGETNYANAIKELFMRGYWLGEMVVKDRQGRTLITESRWTLFREGSEEEILSVDTDLTQRKQLEQHFLRSQRLESIGTLAGGIAHDLNNILMPILMGTGLLRENPQLSSAGDILDNIEESARKGADLVRQILTFARGMEGNRQPTDLAKVLTAVRNIIEKTFPADIELQVAPGRNPGTVHGDGTQLTQVLLNLCVNARDAMPGGGTLTITSDNFLLDEETAAQDPGLEPGKYLVLHIQDTGQGMTEQVMDRIFDPFFTTKEVGQGTGIGLPSTLGIVRSHGGFIKVKSIPGSGSTFSVYLPLQETSAWPESGEDTAQVLLQKGRGELILVVDDNSFVLDITCQTLADFGYQTLPAHNPEEALEVFYRNKTRIHLLLTDLMMARMDGIALSLRMREKQPNLPVIVTSGMDTPENRLRLEEAGISFFLPKPSSREHLLRTVAAALDKTTGVEPAHQ